MATKSAFSQDFDGKKVQLKGVFLKEVHKSQSKGGLEWKIMEMEVDEDCEGWGDVKAAVKAAPPIRSDNMAFNILSWHKKVRRDILSGESRSISVLGQALSFTKVGQRGTVTGTLALQPNTSQVQIMASDVKMLAPETTEELKMMLVGMMHNVGDKTAQAMVSKFGLKTLEVLSSDDAVSQLSTIRGMGPLKAQNIKEQWDSSASKALLHQRLQSQYGLSPLLSLAVAERLSSLMSEGESNPLVKAGDEELISFLRKDPYASLLGVTGLSFTDVDNLAASLGDVSSDLTSRASFAIAQTLADNASDGLTHVPWSKVKVGTLMLLKRSPMGKWDEDKVPIASAAVEFALQGFITLEQMDKDGTRTLVKDAGSLQSDTRVYLRRLHTAEKELAQMLAKRISDSWDAQKSSHGARTVETDTDGLTSEQSMAVKLSLSSPISLLTGGAGVGKTSTCKIIISSWLKAGKRVAVCAPTGRASQRLQEAMGNSVEYEGLMPEATTIHRLLGFRGGPDQDAQFVASSVEGSRLSEYLNGLASRQFDASNPLPIDCLLVDESSMLDLQLAHALFTSLPPSCQVLFVGDHNQLPPVGCGHVLSALLALRKSATDLPAIPRVHLEKVFRSSSTGSIVAGALQIIDGSHPSSMKATSMEQVEEMLNEANGSRIKTTPRELAERFSSDALLIEVPDSIGQNELESLAVDLTAALKATGMDVAKDLQLLSPLVRGSSALNVRAQPIMNPRRGGRLGGNDRVMQVVNNYEKQVFNGELGTVSYASEKDKVVKVSFPRQGIVEYEGSSDRELALAWSTTIHKSQGGEYPAVLLVLDHNGLGLLGSRQLLYTAVTRSKELLILISTSSALRICLRGNVALSGGGGGLCIANRAASELRALGRDVVVTKPATETSPAERPIDEEVSDRSNVKWAVKQPRARIKL